jgi:predicted SPOUT superfamily RNA methylase MTH1
MNFFIIAPTNIFSDIPSLREKTVRVANLVRTLLIFRARGLILFKYGKDDEELYRLIEFFKVPSYLRKFVFKKEKALKYVGVAPPIRAFYEDSDFARYGFVIKSENGVNYVNIGLKDLVKINSIELKEKSLVKVVREKEKWRIAKKEEDFLFGFELIFIEDLINYLNKIKNKENIIFATSRYGKEFSLEDLKSLNNLVRTKKNIYLLFGSPKEGLYEIFKKLNKNLEEYADFVYNMFPNQGVKTIRTDEAIFGSLAILNLLIPKSI